ncbi:MAG: hypothetical protein V1858_04465 [Candidatus Gottesmanbacteria bacterium]
MSVEQSTSESQKINPVEIEPAHPPVSIIITTESEGGAYGPNIGSALSGAISDCNSSENVETRIEVKIALPQYKGMEIKFNKSERSFLGKRSIEGESVTISLPDGRTNQAPREVTSHYLVNPAMFNNKCHILVDTPKNWSDEELDVTLEECVLLEFPFESDTPELEINLESKLLPDNIPLEEVGKLIIDARSKAEKVINDILSGKYNEKI